MKLWIVTIECEVPVLADDCDDATEYAEEAMMSGDICYANFAFQATEMPTSIRYFDRAIPFGILQDNQEDLTVAQLRDKLVSEEETEDERGEK